MLLQLLHKICNVATCVFGTYAGSTIGRISQGNTPKYRTETQAVFYAVSMVYITCDSDRIKNFGRRQKQEEREHEEEVRIYSNQQCYESSGV